MQRTSKALVILTAICLLTSIVQPQKSREKIEITAPKGYVAPVFEQSPELQTVLTGAVGEAVNSVNGPNINDISATVIDLRDPNKMPIASFAGEEPIYPASVVKMFYMAALHQQLEDDKVVLTKELERGLRDMIVDSSNEATQYILDVLTDTSSGGELPQAAFDRWQYKRNRVNRYFTSMGYTNINVNQKTFCEDAYGIEQQSRAYQGKNRNMITTNATARLLAEIALGKSVTPERSRMMMDLMKRDPFADTKDPDSQATGFIGKALIEKKMTDAKLWSKAGWTSRARHDAAYIETSDGRKFVLVIYTENHSTKRELIPAIAGRIIEAMPRR